MTIPIDTDKLEEYFANYTLEDLQQLEDTRESFAQRIEKDQRPYEIAALLSEITGESSFSRMSNAELAANIRGTSPDHFRAIWRQLMIKKAFIKIKKIFRMPVIEKAALFEGHQTRKELTVSVKTVYRQVREDSPQRYSPKDYKKALAIAKKNILHVTINATKKGFENTIISDVGSNTKEAIHYLQFSPQIYEAAAKGGDQLYHPKQPDFVKAVIGTNTSATPMIVVNSGYFNLNQLVTTHAPDYASIGPHIVPGVDTSYVPHHDEYTDSYYSIIFPGGSITTSAPLGYDSKLGNLFTEEHSREERFRKKRNDDVVPGTLTHLFEKNPRSGVSLVVDPNNPDAEEDKTRVVVTETDYVRGGRLRFTGAEWARVGEALSKLNKSHTTFVVLDSGNTVRLFWIHENAVHFVTPPHHSRESPSYIVFEEAASRLEQPVPYVVARTDTLEIPYAQDQRTIAQVVRQEKLEKNHNQLRREVAAAAIALDEWRCYFDKIQSPLDNRQLKTLKQTIAASLANMAEQQTLLEKNPTKQTNQQVNEAMQKERQRYDP